VDPVVVPALVATGFVVFGGLRWYFGREQRLKRRLRSLPVQPIAETPEGKDVRVAGRLAYVDGNAPLTAPISGRPCAAWRVVVEEMRGGGGNNNSKRKWVAVVTESEARDFLLEDSTGRARVDGTLVELVLDFDSRGSTGVFRDASPQLKDFLFWRGIATEGLVFNKNMRYREGILEAGEKVTVAGSGRWENDPSQRAGGYREVGRILRVGAMEGGELLATDDPKAST